MNNLLSKAIQMAPKDKVFVQKMDNLQEEYLKDTPILSLPHDEITLITYASTNVKELTDTVTIYKLEQSDPDNIRCKVNHVINGTLETFYHGTSFNICIKEGKITLNNIDMDNITSFSDKEALEILSSPVIIFLNSMQDKETMMGELKTTIGVKKRKKKNRNKFITKKVIKNITYITNKRLNLSGSIFNHVKIWTHAFRVVGHWRKISPTSIGKNRDGDYCIPGATWINPCIKNKELRYIPKIKVIK